MRSRNPDPATSDLPGTHVMAPGGARSKIGVAVAAALAVVAVPRAPALADTAAAAAAPGGGVLQEVIVSARKVEIGRAHV